MRDETAAAAEASRAGPSLFDFRAGPRRVLFVPFLAAAGLVLLVASGLQRATGPGWAVGAIAAGLVAAALSFAWTLRRGSVPLAALPPRAGDPDEADPLASVKVVEDQGRRHRKPCPNCGTQVGTDREKCPSCGHQVLLDCKGCRTRVRLEWGNCPECGRELP